MLLESKKRPLVIFILGLLSAVAPFSIDMYLPGFPAIAKDLNTSVDVVSYSLASFFVGVCIGQLICGPLLDRFGRKRPMIIGLSVYIVASFGCAISPTIEVLIGFRFLQALFGCVSMVAPRAVVRDLFPVSENAKVLALLILVLGVSPILAPTAGSLVIAAVGWNYVFVLLAALAFVIMLMLVLWLPESRAADPTFLLRPSAILASYWTVLKHPQFYTYAIAGGVGSAGLFAYLSGSPFVFMSYFGVSEHGYGLIFACIAVGLISSSQLNSYMLTRFSSEQMMRNMLMIQNGIGLCMVFGTWLGVLNLYGTVFLIFLFLSCQGFCFPNSAALCMAPFTREAGSASALMGALQMGLGALSAAAVGALNAKTPLPMVGIMASCSMLGLCILLFGRKKVSKHKAETLQMTEK